MIIFWICILIVHTTFMAASAWYWLKLIGPAIGIIKSAEAISPLLEDLRAQLTSAPATLAITEEVIRKLDEAAEIAKIVAENLEASHVRAEEIPSPEPGEASDAAMIRPQDE